MVKVVVPATSANLGPGFDVMGLAIDLFNEIEVEEASGGITVEVEGEGAAILAGNTDNLVTRTVKEVFSRARHQFRGLRLRLINRIPLKRGLGSSAAAIVGAILAANELTGRKLSNQDILNLATEIEGHPDNVTPALAGGITLSFHRNNAMHYLRFMPPKPGLRLVIAIPDYLLSTHQAREALPSSIPHSDGVFNVSRSALLVAALMTGEFSLLHTAMEDRLHQPYRAPLIPGFSAVLQAASQAGALGAALSGAGPAVLAFVESGSGLETAVGESMVAAFAENGLSARFLVQNISPQGAKVEYLKN